MCRCLPIESSKDQVDQLFNKHIFNKIKSSSYFNIDGIGYVSLKTSTDKLIEYQMRKAESHPCFVEVKYFGMIRYDIYYPEEINNELFQFLKKEGIAARNKFWKGGEI